LTVPLCGLPQTVKFKMGASLIVLPSTENPKGVGRKKRMARTLQVAPRATRKPRSIKTAPTLEQIQARAYEIYLERRGAPGSQIDDWLRAERELASDAPSKPRKAARSPKSESEAA
jgi:hypothetical protein